jgi:hypothetical protein
MITTETDLLPSSELQFVDVFGSLLPAPAEWTAAFVDTGVDPGQWADVRCTVNDRPVEVSVRRIGGEPRVVAQWDRAGAGWYDIAMTQRGLIRRRRLQVRPAKIDDGAFARMLEDLETRLPVTIAIALRDWGARIGVPIGAPSQHTLATEVARVRRAVYGTPSRAGLLQVLEALGRDPHHMLETHGEWVRRERVRRPDPLGLVQALWRGGNTTDGKLHRVIDRRVEHTVDLYENRIMRAFVIEVERHARALRGVLGESQHEDLAAEVSLMVDRLVTAKRQARFLEEVGSLQASPGRVSMVLLKRMDYRAGYEGFLEFRRRTAVRLDDPTLAEPLRNLPHLYQLWGTLLVLDAVIEAAGGAGYSVYRQRLVWPQAGGLFLRVLPDGRPALEMRNESGDRLQVIPERSYGQSGARRSVSFTQRPDVAVELTRSDGRCEVIVLDPKYKLVSEDGADPGDGSPKKVDVDKMHAYRDAIRGPEGEAVVRYATTLYPGKTVEYGNGLAALRMYPGEEDRLRTRLEGLIRGWVGGDDEF